MTEFYKLGMWHALYTVKLAVNPSAIQNPGLRAQVQSPASGFRQPQGQGAVGQPPPPTPPTQTTPTPGTGPGTPGPTGTPTPPTPGGNPFSSPTPGGPGTDVADVARRTSGPPSANLGRKAPMSSPAGDAPGDVGSVIGGTGGAPTR
jgi:hypothetical protein